EDPDSYINRKQYFSIQLQGVVNHQRKFIDVFVGYPGSVHDARVFNESELNECLTNICGDGTYILADSAYPCLPHVLVPYRDNGQLTRAQINFNQKLNSCRITSENSFADLKQRFRQLYHFKLRNIVRMVQVINACCILHNIGNANDMDIFEPPLDDAYPDPALAQYEHVQVAQYEHEEHVQNNTGQIVRDEICRQLATRL
ncbi:putative nuclease HARBI1, partial [Mycetomoellerius zeteki]|uniref:putative nuclease HARBI1 n=1 Tax=Mycetomoellerius zeteki TaxID=64791 RepID=UPI00084EA211